MFKKPLLALICILLTFFPSQANAYWVWSPEQGKFINPVDEVGDAAEEQYHFAMQFFKEGNLDEALKQLEDLLEKYPSSAIAPEAQYRLGTIYEERGDYNKAFEAYKVILESYPQSDRLNEVVEREYRIGNLFLGGQKGKVLGLKMLPSLPLAIKVFEHIVENAPYSQYGDKAQYRLGIAYRQSGKFEESLQAFEKLIQQYPQSELVPDARFQLAETSFRRSTVQFRDQRALDEASQEVDRFLTRHPAGEGSERAARLRQEIDEKNAEKNYRIGLYYEKTDYLKSALIYYSDVAKRYPHTTWGQKAADKIKALESPAEFLTEEMKELEGKMAATKEELSNLPKDAELERGRLERKMERLEERAKNVEKSKKQTLESRRKDLKRREGELKEKYKRLKKKEKLLEKNPSADLKKALERWHASLEGERLALMEEKRQLAGWESELGMEDGFSWSFLPFVGEPKSELDQVRDIEADKYFKVASEKKSLLSEKELLYKQYGEISMMMKQVTARTAIPAEASPESLDQEMRSQGIQGMEKTEAEIKRLEIERDALRKQLHQQTQLYEKHYGKGWLSWVGSSAGLVAKPLVKSVEFINPFDSEVESLDNMSLEQMLERRMHLREKMAAQKGLVDTLHQAFNNELAMQEQKRLMKDLENAEKIDPAVLRKSIRQTERDLRSRYEEIQDRHEKKRELVAELEQIIKQTEESQGLLESAATTAAKPFKKAAFISKAFLFGLPGNDVTVSESAKTIPISSENRERVEEIQRQLEEESVLIEIRNREILQLRKELEILNAKASLAGGYKFRSVFVDLPYSFIRDAVDSAHRLVPKTERDEVIIGLLDEESTELEKVKAELNRVEQAVKEKSAGPRELREKKEMETQDDAAAPKKEQVPDEETLQMTIRALSEQIAIKERDYRHHAAILESQKNAFDSQIGLPADPAQWKKYEKQLTQEQKKLKKELEEIEKSLSDLIELESRLEQEEVAILRKRINKINDFMNQSISNAMVSDLKVERERLEDRLSQIELRRDFLLKELERFNMPESPAKP